MGMSNQKIHFLLEGYEAKLQKLLKIEDPAVVEKLKHALEMIPKMRKFLLEGRREKVFRWLGFLQCVFWMLDIYTVEDLANHSRPTREDLRFEHVGHTFDVFGCQECKELNQLSSCKYTQEYRDAPEKNVPII